MSKVVRSALMAGTFAVCVAASLTAARAEVIRVAVVTAGSATDYQSNAALVPAFAALLKKGSGVKAVYAGTDAANMSITTTSVWANEADIAAVTGSAERKAEADKLKSKSYTIGVFQLAP